MSKISFSPNFQNINTVDEVCRFLSQFSSSVKSVVNGNLALQENFRNQLVEINFTLANQEYAVAHTLGSPIVGVMDWGTTSSGTVYFSTKASTAAFVYLKASTNGARRVLLFS